MIDRMTLSQLSFIMQGEEISIDDAMLEVNAWRTEQTLKEYGV